ncbi:MAG: tail fiber domain-containing protein [Phycisphaerales bacterium]|nr:tail fiber domain-containing protein [Phycisphaerales bacterium]
MSCLLARMCGAMLALSAVAMAGTSDTAFTYQGRLRDGGLPANGNYNISLKMWDAAVAGSQIGSTQAFLGVPVAGGVFAIEVDFGASAFDGAPRWLEITVGPQTLSPRQALTGAPMSVSTRGLNVDPAGKIGIGTDMPGEEVEIVADHPTLRLTATDALVTSLPRLEFRGGPGPSIFQGIGAIDFRNELGEQRALIQTSKAGPTGAIMTCTVTPGSIGQLSLTQNEIRVAGDLAINRRSDNTHSAFIGTDGANSYFQAHGGSVGIGLDNPDGFSKLQVVSNGADATIFGSNTGAPDFHSGVRGQAAGTNGAGVFGTALSDAQYGVFGESFRNNGGIGVAGFAKGSGVCYGVWGVANDAAGWDFFAAGNGQNYGAFASARWQKNAKAIADPLDKLAQVNGVVFEWDDEHGGHEDVGMIAEEVGQVLPWIVKYEANGTDAIGMDYSKTTPLLVEAVKELHAKHEALRAENDYLRERLERLELLLGAQQEVAGAPGRAAKDPA